jgi:hypothetical protein
MKMWETKCSGCGKMTPANQCPQLMMIPLCKPCWLKSTKMINKVVITPQTYIDMNEEFIKEDIPFRISIPTQEAIDKWQSQPPQHIGVVHEHDMVAEMWAEHNRIEEERKLQLELDL